MIEKNKRKATRKEIVYTIKNVIDFYGIFNCFIANLHGLKTLDLQPKNSFKLEYNKNNKKL